MNVKQGDRVVFRDGSATVKSPKVVEREGFVNGKPMIPYVPVWSEREGREATTVMVHQSNIVKVWQAA